jgi:hypothetical protein
MDYLSEVLKIISNGVNGNKESVKDYSLLLSDKLHKDGKVKEAELVRKRAMKDDAQETFVYPVSNSSTKLK